MSRTTIVNGKNVTKKLQKGDVLKFRLGHKYIEVYVTRRKQNLNFVREVDGEKRCSICYTFRPDDVKEVMEFMSRLISLTTNRAVEVSVADGVIWNCEYNIRLK